MAVAHLLKKYMARRNLSDVELAERIGGVTRETVYRWRTGTIKAPKYDKAIKCAKILELNPQERSEFFMAAGWPDPQGQVFAPQATVEENTEPVVGITTRPIIYARDFFGRDDVLKRLANAWRRVPLEHVAIIGPKRCGKTSLLNFIVDSRSAQANKRDGWPTIVEKFVYVDLDGKRMQRIESFLSHVLNQLGLKIPEDCDVDRFVEIVDEDVRKPTLFLIDNLEKGLAAPEMDDIFWDGMRSLSYGANGQLGFCVTSCESLEDLEKKSEDKFGESSAFFGIFESNELKPFTEQEARQFISAAPQGFSEKDTQWLLENSRQWPILLQELCKIALDEKDWKKAGKKKLKEYENKGKEYEYLFTNT
jgi:transcriptional regulator with XRE-family HTH domain